MTETFEGVVQITTVGSHLPGGRTITLDGREGSIELYGASAKREMFLNPKHEGGKYSALFLGEQKAGIMVIRDSAGKDSIRMDGAKGDVYIFDDEGHRAIALQAKAYFDNKTTGLWIGANSTDNAFGVVAPGPKAGYVAIRNSNGDDSIEIDGRSGDLTLYDADRGRGFALRSKEPSLGTNTTGMWIGASKDEGQKAGYVAIRNSNGDDSIEIDGRSGDIILTNADCAEDFDIAESVDIEPGTVMVIDQDGKLRQSNMAYDKRVAGVVSGAQNYKPGLVLDKRKSIGKRKSISLMGKVHCKVDAQSAPIDVGDLLTTSSTTGHAMKAADPVKAFGSVIGKALRPLKAETGLIPILIALQ